MDSRTMKPRYTQEEKEQLLANLEIEVAHRTSQFQAWLEDALENFNIHQEGHVIRIPKLVRGMKMRDFGAKYNGNVQAALKGIQRQRLEAAAVENGGGGLSETIKKRKWAANQEAIETAASTSNQGEPSRAMKTARLMPPSPSKPVAQRQSSVQPLRTHPLPKTPKMVRSSKRVDASPSPSKPKPPFISSGFSRVPSSRPASPVKTGKPLPSSRVPSVPTFNPSLLSKGPAYPGLPARLPRKDESMLSVNGSPLANPYEFGMGWFKGSDPKPATGGNPERTLRKANSIIIRRDTSGSSFHSRTDSQASLFTSAASSSSHSRTSSESVHDHQPSHFSNKPPAVLPAAVFDNLTTPKPIRSLPSATVALTTKDGHVLEIDPLQASPGTIDALEGITDSAKKQARDDMVRLVQAAVDKWKI
ncbi:hypothetical protein PC9H_010767 [Pleurotus ostreatus]|uniref:Borealin N-terminal domain-containing protein n=2 Tax=Pleurotus TaxID=5320 RepID=A0A8H6ZN30_PLEOS|nr:uncharacterized protein PC9H_010767 [Pleurotus ostreatus]KAF7422611.1 hypothetical protein PC9H_010767 [Pleurotus ostreatus]KAG9227530.1 hypothetical protein CCMSSC00406_0000824 [Pleurotus cornucopiae]KAJ8691512.1 hypothetical protein PTI98_011078 [Pleurotus ostreatus]